MLFDEDVKLMMSSQYHICLLPFVLVSVFPPLRVALPLPRCTA